LQINDEANLARTQHDLPDGVVRTRNTCTWGLLAFLVLIAVGSLGLGLASGASVTLCSVVGLTLCGVMLAVMLTARSGYTTRMTMAACLAVALMLLIYAAAPLGDGAVQQAHMFYFVTNSFLVFYMCWRSQLLYNVLVVAHHVVLTFLAPALIWHATDFTTSVLDLATHAGIAIILVGPLLAASQLMLKTAVGAENGLRDARAAMERADLALSMQVRAQQSAIEDRRTLVKDVRHRLGVAFDDIVSSFEQAAAAVQERAELLTAASAGVGRAADAIVGAVEQTEQTLASIAATAIELDRSVVDVCSQAAEAAISSAEAARQAEAAAQTIRLVSQSCGEIQSFLVLINDIADRTNLLALNATIESARAGDAGRGFAVVAGEVKQLATQTSRATETVRQQITAMAESTSVAVVAIDDIRQSIQTADGRTGAIANASQAQQKALSEIADNVNSVAAASSRNTAQIRTVQTSYTEIRSSGEQLLALVSNLSANVVAARVNALSLVDSLAA
jgi:methyl-accepting chemotaxis protein